MDKQKQVLDLYEVNGLKADLESAIYCAWNHGAKEWVKQNYPAHYEKMTGEPCKPGDQADVYGRVWRHCESGLALTKASMSRFIMYCMKNRVEIGDMYAFDPEYHGSAIIASVRLRPDQFEHFESETGGKLTRPPVICLN